MPSTQLRLLLWKDYLIRRRKLVALLGIAWATAVVTSLYIVRANIDNVDYPTCQFPARALPSAGMVNFLQSFICSVNNECRPLEQYDEIPTYDNSKLTQLQRKFAPLIYNETVLDVATTVPDALRLLSKLADVVDQPTFIDISKNGLRVQDLFNNPGRVKRYLSTHLGVSGAVAQSVMTAQMSMQGIFNGNLNKCNTMISGVLRIVNKEHLEVVTNKLCSLTERDVQRILLDLLMEVNFSKYINMIGDMYYKVSGDNMVSGLGDTVTAVLRMTRLQSFLPAELVAMLQGEMDFSYFDLELITKLIDLFKPTFGETDSYKNIRDISDTLVNGVQFLGKFLAKHTDNMELVELANTNTEKKAELNMDGALNNAIDTLDEAMSDNSIDIFDLLAQVFKMIHRWLPEKMKHDVLLYSTLLTKLIEGANHLITINMHIEQRAYDASLRHPDGVKVLTELPSDILAKGFEGLIDPERIQIMTAKISNTGQMFCDLNRLQGFFKMSKDEATSLRNKLCSDAWKNYISDLIKTFGVHDVKNNINMMASLLIQETLGKDTSDQLYTVDYDFQVLKNFTKTLSKITTEDKPDVNWKKVFNATEDSDFMKTVKSKAALGKQMLVVAHGALAKEIVNQNTILSFKIGPGLIDTTTLVIAVNKQLDATPPDLAKRVKEMYPAILETILRTAVDENKTYKSLSGHSEDIMCNNVEEASTYLNFPENVDVENLLNTLCDWSKNIEKGMRNDSILAKALDSVLMGKKEAFADVKWTTLISGLKDLYVKLDTDYPYLFKYSSYGMRETQIAETQRLVKEATDLWFNKKRIRTSMHLGFKVGFRVLDLVDRGIWNVTAPGWLKTKYILNTVTGPLEVVDDFITAVAETFHNETYKSKLPPRTIDAFRTIIPSIPQLVVDGVDLIVEGSTELESIIALLNDEPPWPCSATSLADLLALTASSQSAVRALETLMCDQNLHSEWQEYLDGKNITAFDLKKFNTTDYPPHVFLKFSTAFDGLIRDGSMLKTVVEDISSDGDGVTWRFAWDHVMGLFNRTERDDIFSNFFSKLDIVLPSINTTTPEGSLFSLWQNYLACNKQPSQGTCRDTSRLAWKYTLQFFSVMFKEAASDLLVYFKEFNEPTTTLLQILGFTKRTPLYGLYDNIGHYMGVLLNSYWDHGFMSQVRKASLSTFWDCEGLLRALVPPPGSPVHQEAIARVQPFICPSFLYWISLPKGDNTLLDVVAKPQYYFYKLNVQNLTTSYQEAFNKISELTKFFIDVANKNETVISEEDVKHNTLQEKLENLVDTVLNYEINQTDPSYNLFTELNRKQFAITIYLTRIVAIIDKLVTNMNNFNATEDLKADLNSIQTQYKRKTDNFIELHFDIITDVVWRNDENYNLVEALDNICDNIKNNDLSKQIVVTSNRVANVLCSKRYKDIYGEIQNEVTDDFEGARFSLLNLMKMFGDGKDNVTDVVEFFNQRKQIIDNLKKSISYSYELSIPIYLKYLQSTLQHYDVILSFVNGGDWWRELRDLYSGPQATKFFDSLERSFEITEDILGNLDKIHLVRLFRDININDTESICQPNITLSEYIPDVTGAISYLKSSLCENDYDELIQEIPPLLFAEQGYGVSNKMSKEVNHTSLNLDIAKTEDLLDLATPLTPQRPFWVTEDKLMSLRRIAVGLLSKETLTSIAFGVISNMVDAGTLFLTNSQCTLCSQLTSWIKQLNLQVFKKQDYDTLLCHIQDMSLEDIHHTLKNDFHWDMAIQELILTRNYTKYELNKSLHEFLELVKLHLLEDILTDSNKLADCLMRNVTRNGFGNATLFVTILSKTARLLRAEAPHLHEIEGITTLPYFTQLKAQIAHNLDVYGPLKKYIGKDFENELKKVVNEEIADVIKKGDLNLHMLLQNGTSVDQLVRLQRNSWEDICIASDCNNIYTVIKNNVNTTMVQKDLPDLQTRQFWKFTFVSRILKRIEELLHYLSRLVAVASRADAQGLMDGRLASWLDFLLQLLRDDVTNDLLYSINGLVKDLHPLLQSYPLEHDLRALAAGLTALQHFRNQLLEKEDLKVEVRRYFPHPERLESGLERLGINNTNFWSIAAPRIHTGYFLLKPILTEKEPNEISTYVCQPEQMSQVIIPSDLDVVTADDVYGATIEQFCGLDDERVKRMLPVLVGGLNFSAIFEKVANTLLPQLYAAANLTTEQGDQVLQRYPQMMELLPLIQENVGDLGETIATEPLVQSLGKAESLGGLLGSSSFLSNAGHMLCGRPFETNQNRFYKAIASTKDFNDQVDTAQLDALPTEFCRDLYRDIISMEGGKVVWSLVKPLIMGKILYTPATPTVERIMHRANTSFALMIKLASIVHSFAGSFSSIEDLSVHREGVSALRRIITSPSFEDLKTMLVGNGSVPDVDVGAVFDDFGGYQGISRLLKKGSDLLHCVNLNRFVPVADEIQLAYEAAKLSRVNEFSAGIVFLNTKSSGDTPRKIEYKIRMDIENAPTTARMKNYLWIPGPESSFIEHMRYFRGFVQIQDMIDNAIIQLSRSNTSRGKREIKTEDQWAIYTQQEPYPCYRKDYYQTSLYESQAFIVALVFSLLFTVASAVRFSVSEKETGNTMLMSVMGVNLSYHTLSWWLMSLAEITVTVVCMTLVLKLGGVLPHTETTLLLAIMFIFGFSVLSFCYMMSKLFTSASAAAVSTAIAYLVSFMPFVVILSLEAVVSNAVKLLVCISMSSAISYSCLSIARLEATGVGAHWSDVWSAHAQGELGIAAGAAMALLDAGIYFAIGLLLDRFFGPKTLQTSITNCTTSTEKAGVSIVNVSKVYNEGTRRAKVALNNVSIELHKGQVTALLGHNGAGKTTLINIIMGTLKPSGGHITIRSEPSALTRVGVCPQRDVLYDHLTAREHIALFAQLKTGVPLAELQDEVQSLLQVLSLGPVSDEPVHKLSGGTRRRLCVALAFVGKPQLVSLDEPTAGVDPAARRDIWSMIVKLRKDRTILLTTHHLDEAELLSDQIVIMHKGQVHTSGSPIEIKRSLGNGYKLTVVFPAGGGAAEERLLSLVHSCIGNATVCDVTEGAVDMQLPLFDATGVHNDFLKLCTTLEAQQSALGFSSYNLECSTLEHVFFNVCHQADNASTSTTNIECDADSPSKSASSLSVRSELCALVPPEGALAASLWTQLRALLLARYIHYTRNRWLLFLLLVLPFLFVTTAMAFSMVRPPPDNEVSLRLAPALYGHTTEYLVPDPSIYTNSVEPIFARKVMDGLRVEDTREWSAKDTPPCKCMETKQVCELEELHLDRPEMMVLPDTNTLNQWLVATHDAYIEKRYGGYSSSIKNNKTNLIAWYNNKGHHALPAFINALNNAVLRAVSGDLNANITVYSHPLKISKEQISKDTVYQHVADAGISALVLLGYCLVAAGAAVYLVGARASMEKRLQLLCGVPPALYWAAALIGDLIIIVINMVITVIVFEAFGFPVFVARNNLPAICLLILLFGYSCGSLVHVVEKLFSEASMANMLIFCGNAFIGLAGITLLLILDIISDSDATDNARWVLHKVFLLFPQFALADGLLEIAKNTIQAQVLSRFGMDTYKDPLSTTLVLYHYVAMALVGTALLLLNLAIEYQLFEGILVRFRSEAIPECSPGEMEDLEVAAERRRVLAAAATAQQSQLRLPTIGNINAGFVDTEVKKNSIKRIISPPSDVALCVRLGKAYPSMGGYKAAVRSLTLGIPPGQCTALLGQNGAGKSTTFAMLCGHTRPTTGKLRLRTQDRTRRTTHALISYCPQSDAIDGLLTPRDTLRLYCRLRGLARHEEIIGRTLEMFELTKYADVQNGTLSGGNKRKLGTAIAFMGRTPLVLLDEPTSGMDPLSRACVSRGVRSACAAGRAVLLSTHALDDARRLAARVALMKNGRLVALATLDDCLKRFGGGWVVSCRSRSPAAAWRGVAARAPHARLQLRHRAALHFLLPLTATVNKKEVTTKLSDVFRLMAELQSTCDIEDYTVNQSSLDQMFLSFTEKHDEELEPLDLEPLPTPGAIRRHSGELNSITAL